MNELLLPLAILVVWLALNVWVLPKAGQRSSRNRQGRLNAVAPHRRFVISRKTTFVSTAFAMTRE